jgi:hypothetical protein
MVVDIEKLKEARRYIREVNDAHLAELTWDGGAPSAEEIFRWRFVGLNNVDFIEHAGQLPAGIAFMAGVESERTNH